MNDTVLPGANPGDYPDTVNPRSKNDRRCGLNAHEQSVFSGICEISTEQFLECYSYLDRGVTPEILRQMCAKCAYAEEPSRWANTNRHYSITYPYYLREGGWIDEELDTPKAFVYFVSDSCYIKIGVAKDPDARLREIQTGNPNDCDILCLIPCTTEKSAYALEKALHRVYSHRHRRGEWYDLLGYIDHMKWRDCFPPEEYGFGSGRHQKGEAEAING